MEDIIQAIFVKEIIAPVLIIIVSIIIHSFAKRAIKKIFKRRGDGKQKTLMSLLLAVIKYLILVIDIFMILEIFGVDTKSLTASLGVLSLVAGLALQDIAKDFISGFSIIFENQYKVGDIVTIAGFKGEVISVGLRSTKIKSIDGDIKTIVNRNITETINHTVSSSVVFLDIPVGYEEDLGKIEIILKKLCERLSKELEFLTDDIKCLGTEKLQDSSVAFRLSIQTEPNQQYAIRREVIRAVLDEFKKNNISVPLNKMVIKNA